MFKPLRKRQCNILMNSLATLLGKSALETTLGIRMCRYYTFSAMSPDTSSLCSASAIPITNQRQLANISKSGRLTMSDNSRSRSVNPIELDKPRRPYGNAAPIEIFGNMSMLNMGIGAYVTTMTYQLFSLTEAGQCSASS